jgi:beta-xylosidase
MIICVYVYAGDRSDKIRGENCVDPAVKNSIKFNYDLIDRNSIDELSELSDDFNLPVLRSHWNPPLDQSEWSLKERPGYLRIKAQKKTTFDDIFPEGTFSQKIKLNASGEAVSMVDLSSMHGNANAGLYYSGEKINYIGIQSENGNKKLIVCIDNKIYDGPELTGNDILLRLKIDVSKAWFEFSYNGIDYVKLGCIFKLNVGNDNNNVVGIFCLNGAGGDSSVDFDWFYFNPRVDSTIHYAETKSEILIPEI